MLIVKSNIRHAAEVDGKHYYVSADFAEALDLRVRQMIRKACERARDNGRNTVMPRDI